MPGDTTRAGVRADVVLAGVAVLVGIALRLVPHPAGLWLDELYTAYAADPGVPFREAFWERAVPDFQPPLYYPLMWAWHHVAGTGEAAMRSLGGLAGVAGLGACAALLRPVLAPRVLVTVVAVLALAWPGIFYAQEARSYALLYALAAVGCALVVRDAAGRQRPWTTATLLAVAVLAGGVHYYGMVLGCALFAARALASGARRDAVADIGLAVVLAALFVAVLAWQVPLHGAGVPGWHRNNWPRMARLYGEMLAPNDLAAGALALLGALALTGRVAGPAQRALLTAAALCVAVPVLLSLHTPMLTARYLIITVPPLALWAAVRAGQPAGRWRGAALALALAALAAADVRAWTRIHREDWRAAAALVVAQHAPGCPVPVWGKWGGIYAYYLPAPLRAALVHVPPQGPVPPQVPGCRVLLWAGHPQRLALAPPPGTRVVHLYGQAVWLAPPASR